MKLSGRSTPPPVGRLTNRHYLTDTHGCPDVPPPGITFSNRLAGDFSQLEATPQHRHRLNLAYFATAVAGAAISVLIVSDIASWCSGACAGLAISLYLRITMTRPEPPLPCDDDTIEIPAVVMAEATL